jgi:hypothetical protein
MFLNNVPAGPWWNERDHWNALGDIPSRPRGGNPACILFMVLCNYVSIVYYYQLVPPFYVKNVYTVPNLMKHYTRSI